MTERFVSRSSASFAAITLAKISLIGAAALLLGAGAASADPTLPTIGSTVYNVTVSNSAINGGVAASSGSSDNSAAINAYIAFASANGGGTVEIPSGTFDSNEITMASNVNLQIDAGGVLMNDNPAATLITTPGSATTNIEISGAGAIDGGATTAVSGSDLVVLKKVTNLEVTGVTIENSTHEHLVPEEDHNVTINNVTIADPGTLTANGGNYLANTDGIDFSGTNFLIENSSIQDGDDDIVAKPASFATGNVVINNDTIGAGHGISIGGGSAKGLSNMLVENTTFNGTENGIRIKAEDASGGDAGGGILNPVTGITYENLTMNDVNNPIIIDSFYNGNNNFPISPTETGVYPSTPTALDSTAPVFSNILFKNINVTGAGNAGLIFGLNTDPNSLSGLKFVNVNISAAQAMEMWYAAEVEIDSLDVTVPNTDPFAAATPFNGVDLFNVQLVPLPAAASIALPMLALLGAMNYIRVRKSRSAAH
jgi:polygalacturonase